MLIDNDQDLRGVQNAGPCWHNGRMATTPPGPARPVTPPKPQPTTGPASPTSAPAPTPPKPKPAPDLDWLTLRQARTFGVVLRNGQTWQQVKLLEMDRWSLLVETAHADELAARQGNYAAAGRREAGAFPKRW